MIRKDIKTFAKSIPNGIRMVVATKYYDVNDLSVLLDNDINDFGENRVDSFLPKYEYFAEWFIEHKTDKEIVKNFEKEYKKYLKEHK